MRTRDVTDEQVNAEIAAALSAIGLTWDELEDRRRRGVLTPEQWEAWDRVDGLRYLLGY